MMISNFTNKKWKKLFICILSLLILTTIIELFVFNKHIVFGAPEEKVINLSNLKTKGFDNVDGKLLNTKVEGKIFLDIKDEYVGKIQVKYKAANDFVTNIVNYEENTFGKSVKVSHRGKNILNTSSNLSILSQPINAKVNASEMRFVFSSELSVEIESIKTVNELSFNIARFSFFFLIFITISILALFRNFFFKRIERTFLIIALVTGTLIITFTPSITYLSMDDIVHYKKAATLFSYNSNISKTENELTSFQIFHKDMINSKEELASLNDYLNVNHLEKPVGSDAKGFIPYSRFGYIPSAITLKIANMASLPFTISFSLGRLTNLIFYALMMFFAIKITPTKKRVFALFALIPTNLYMACNYSLDPIITSCLALSFSMFLREWFSKDKIKIKYVILYLVVTTFGVLPKPIYAPLILLPLLLPKWKFENEKERRQFKMGIFIIFLVLISTFVLPTLLSPKVQGDIRAVGQTSQVGQITSILHNIPGYISVFFNNAGDQFFMKLLSPDTIVSIGYLSRVPENVYYFFIVSLVVFSTINDSSEKNKLRIKDKMFILTLICIIVILIWTALYVDFTEVATVRIRGVQARYFLPILLPILCCLDIGEFTKGIDKERINQFLFILVLIALACLVYFSIIKCFQF